MRQLSAILLLLLSFAGRAQFKGLVVNEFSQGDAGSREYIELVVEGNRTCTDSTADLRGWIVDDQNGWYGTTNGANGHYRFKNSTAWEKVPFGALIVLYNSASGQKNLSITQADDPADANGDLTYILPINSSAYLEEHDNLPTNASGPAYLYPAPSSTTGYAGTSNTWVAHIAFNNTGGDVVSTVAPAARHKAYFSVAYAYSIAAGYQTPSVSLADVAGGRSAALTDSLYRDASKWNIAPVPQLETPGLPNGGANSVWIQKMRTPPTGRRHYTTACSAGPYLFYGQTFALTGAYSVTYNNSLNCTDTAELYVVVKKSDVRDTIACDSLRYKGTLYTANTTIVDHIKSVLIDCDSIVRTLNIIIRKSTSSQSSACVGAGQTFVFNNQTYAASGLYSVLLVNHAGCDSLARLRLVVADLRNDTLTGCGSIVYKGTTYQTTTVVFDTVRSVALGCDSIINRKVLIVNPVKHTTVSVCAVEGDVLNFNGQNISLSGQYQSVLQTAAGCDSTVRLTAVFRKTIQQQFTGCDSVLFRGTWYRSTTIIRDTVRSLLGCDSILLLSQVIVNHTRHTYLSACLQTGQTYNFNGQIITTSGTYTYTYTTLTCDSLVHLTIVAPTTVITSLQGCDSVFFGGIIYRSTTVLRDTIKSSTICDSVYRQTNIVVLLSKTSSKTVCKKMGQPYDFNGQLLATSGIYFTTYVMPNGCDSLVTLFLTVAKEEVQTISGCGAILFSGTTYTAPVTLRDTIRSVLTFCDSLYRTVHIQVLPNSIGGATVCLPAGGTYNFNGQTLTSTGMYTTTFTSAGRCDSTVHLYLLVARKESNTRQGCGFILYNGLTYTVNTSISDTVRSIVTGCDSLIRMTHFLITPLPSLTVPPSPTVCSGDAVVLKATSSGVITWTGFGVADSIVVRPTTTTTYTVQATNAAGCSRTASVTVTVSTFTLRAGWLGGPILPGNAVTVLTSATENYEVLSWQPAALFPRQTAQQQTFFADTSLTVKITGRSLTGCRDTVELPMQVTSLNDVFIPTAFTPNGDGKNDEFRVRATGVKEVLLQIFNRWGGLVFTSADPNKGWDGTLLGKAQQSDTYVYVVRLKMRNGRVVEKKGTVVLIR